MSATDPEDFSSFEAAALQTAKAGRPSVRFWVQAVPDPVRTAEAGRPVARDADHVGITNPGSRDEFVKIVKLNDQKFMSEYGDLYRRWKETQEQPVDGTDLKLIPFLTPAEIEELRYFNVKSLEQLAAVSDQNITKIGPGFREKREQAKAYMQNAKDSAVSTRLAAENMGLKQRITDLESEVRRIGALAAAQPAVPHATPNGGPDPNVMAMMAAMQEQIGKLAEARKPGRPRKNAGTEALE